MFAIDHTELCIKCVSVFEVTCMVTNSGNIKVEFL